MYVSGSFEIDFPSGVSRQSFADPIQHVPGEVLNMCAFASSEMRASSALSPTIVNSHGCRLTVLGALMAASTGRRMAAFSTGSLVNSRTACRP
jgi:hypothetical protein